MQFTGRICFDSDVRHNLIAPCLCNGNIKYVHPQCLDNWRNVPSSNNKNFYSCEICKEKFILELDPNLVNLNYKYKLCIGLEIFAICLILGFMIWTIGKFITMGASSQILFINNSIINNFIIGFIAIMVVMFIIGSIAVIHSNNARFGGLYMNDLNYTPSMKAFLAFVIIIGLIIIFYYIIKYLISIRKRYFFLLGRIL